MDWHAHAAVNSTFLTDLRSLLSSSLELPGSSDSEPPWPSSSSVSLMGSPGHTKVGFNMGGIMTMMGLGADASASAGAGVGAGVDIGAGAGAGADPDPDDEGNWTSWSAAGVFSPFDKGSA